MTDKVPHFSTFGKNYTRRFKDTDLFEQIFTHILTECYKFKLIDPTEIFVDVTHIKARANSRKMQKRIAKEESLLYAKRQETIERIFGTAKENHGFRYTQMFGKVRMEMKVGLTFVCMNLKKLAKMLQRTGKMEGILPSFLRMLGLLTSEERKTVLELSA